MFFLSLLDLFTLLTSVSLELLSFVLFRSDIPHFFFRIYTFISVFRTDEWRSGIGITYSRKSVPVHILYRIPVPYLQNAYSTSTVRFHKNGSVGMFVWRFCFQMWVLRWGNSVFIFFGKLRYWIETIYSWIRSISHVSKITTVKCRYSKILCRCGLSDFKHPMFWQLQESNLC